MFLVYPIIILCRVIHNYSILSLKAKRHTIGGIILIMDDATQILVIITSSVLIIFLLLFIILLLQFIFLIRRIKRLLHKAENVAETVEAVSETLGRAALPAAFGKVLANLMASMSKAQSKRRK